MTAETTAIRLAVSQAEVGSAWVVFKERNGATQFEVILNFL
jgi:hypothetical protein